MKGRTILTVILGCLMGVAFPILAGERPENPNKKKEGKAVERPLGPVKREVTAGDIFGGVEKYLVDQMKNHQERFSIIDSDKKILLTFGKVHNDKLYGLKDGSYFVCVDFKDDDGNAYDIDFFLKGRPGAMAVTETAVRKVNGNLRYDWKQEADGKWTKVSVNTDK